MSVCGCGTRARSGLACRSCSTSSRNCACLELKSANLLGRSGVRGGVVVSALLAPLHDDLEASHILLMQLANRVLSSLRFIVLNEGIGSLLKNEDSMDNLPLA